jgi:hypothetical protein
MSQEKRTLNPTTSYNHTRSIYVRYLDTKYRHLFNDLSSWTPKKDGAPMVP